MKKKEEYSYRTLFGAFLKTGSAFGGGLGVLASLQTQFVKHLKIVDHQEFMAIWGIARVVPGGTMGAIAIALGYKCRKFLGALVAITGLTLPGFSVAVFLTMLYLPLRETPLFEYMSDAVIPAALGLIVLAVINLAKDVVTSKLLIFFASVSFLLSFIFEINPTIILFSEGFVAAVILKHRKERHHVTT